MASDPGGRASSRPRAGPRRAAAAPLRCVEAAYDLRGSTERWLERLAAAARPFLDRDGLGVFAVAHHARRGRYRAASAVVTVGGSQPAMDVIRFQLGTRDDRSTAQMLSSPCGLMTSSEGFEAAGGAGDFSRWQPFEALRAAGIHDALVVLANGPDGYGCNLSGGLARIYTCEAEERRRWHRVATHIAAGLRLRSRLEEAPQGLLDPSGRAVHAEAPIQGRRARDALREAARAIDRARAAGGGHDPDDALETWRGLIAGRWSLVDFFDTDGRRFLVVRRNDPRLPRVRDLTLRERQVCGYAALGYSNKQTAYALGLAPSTVSSHLRSARTRLGVRTRGELAALLAGAVAER